ncbi:MAG: hypothetical protein KGJ34_02700 [Patescibacteria group bacterium]|nr:hypothetical protein [Patescibacteria group bacterium]
MRRSIVVLCAGCIVSACAISIGVFHAQAQSTATSTLQNQINANDQEIAQLNAEIAQYEAELNTIGANKRTLQQAINSLNLELNKIKAQSTITQRQINTTQIQIQQLGVGIASAEQSITQDQAALAEELRELAQDDDEPLILQILSSTDLSQAWSDIDATSQLQASIEDNMYSLQAQKSALTNSQKASQQKQDTLISQKQSLTSQQQTLTQTQQSKAQLLVETNAQESTYEKLLAQAQAQLTSFSAFTTNAGGSGILYDQTSCDAWGCYYNQRDAQWGNDPLDGTQYLLKSDGCLVTAMAMVMTHYGYRDVTPVTINSNPNNFAAYYPAYLLFTIYVDGITATRKAATIDAVLRTGNPVVVGLYAYGGTHFVVLVSGSGGKYVMRDPYVPNGKDISFSAHYSLREIFGVSRVILSS